MSVGSRHLFPTCTALALTSLFSACGGATQTPPAAEAQAEPTESVPEEEAISDEEAELLAQIEESAKIADASAQGATTPPPGPGDDPPAREVIYRVSEDALKVQIDGVEFVPKATAVKVSGGWGVKLTVKATATAERLLWSAPGGPLAFGGAVTRKSREKFGDKKGGGSDVTLAPGPAIEFERTWPAAGEPGLGPNDTLELHVGLWGFGSTPEDRRPVNRFVIVKMKGGSKPVPNVQPPDGGGG